MSATILYRRLYRLLLICSVAVGNTSLPATVMAGRWALTGAQALDLRVVRPLRHENHATIPHIMQMTMVLTIRISCISNRPQRNGTI